MGIIDRIDDAVTDITRAESQLDELAAVRRLELLVCDIRRDLAVAALANHHGGEVGRALGISRQAVNRRYRKKTEPGVSSPAR